MKTLKLTLIAMALLLLGIAANSCSIPGTSGHGRYKTELLSTLAAIEDDIATQGTLDEKNVAKLESVLDKWRSEYSAKGSFLKAEESLVLCRKSLAGEDVFMTNQNIKMTDDRVRSYMQTEGDK